ncbi:hypothetical protein LJR230_005188 [Trinickia sp. LjRoot230]|uniref:hypothetical protein n=1 Tax=Trinickia sp. LjRoot230 TaxID=3342288 RepID=UPI003ED0A6D5
MGGTTVNETKNDVGNPSANDIEGLGRQLPELDPTRYLDEQARLAYEEALVRWPLLARLMGLSRTDADADADTGADARP